ncbi:MAG: vWA domain-containing protein, partial [Promethearchaeota archaeon]
MRKDKKLKFACYLLILELLVVTSYFYFNKNVALHDYIIFTDDAIQDEMNDIAGFTDPGELNNKVREQDYLVISDGTFECNNPLNLNWTIKLNQSAYLPNSVVKATINLFNNLSAKIDSAWLSLDLDQSMTLINGSLTAVTGNVSMNSGWSHSVEFSISDNGTSSLDLVIVLDSSGSMSDEINAVKEKLFDIVDTLSRTVTSIRIGVIIFGSIRYSENPVLDDRNILPLTKNYQVVKDFIGGFDANGGWEPWGDALSILKGINWENDIRLAILIGDEPCDAGCIIGSEVSNQDDYDGDQLRELIGESRSNGIIINTITCSGSSDLTIRQYQEVANGTGGVSKNLDDTDSLVANLIASCQEIIDERAMKLKVNLTVQYNGSMYMLSDYSYVVVDNQGPSLHPAATKVVKFGENGLKINARITCATHDAAGTANVTLNYYWNDEIHQFKTALMTRASDSLFYFDLGELKADRNLTFYVNATDVLGCTSSTNVSIVSLAASIPIIDLGGFLDLVLNPGESVYYQFEIQDSKDLMIEFSSSNEFSCSFLSWNNETEPIRVVTGVNNSFGGHIRLNDFHGRGLILIEYTVASSNDSSSLMIPGTISVSLNEIKEITLGQTSYSVFTNDYRSIIYKFIVPGITDPDREIVGRYYNFMLSSDQDAYLAFRLAIFNGTTILKQHYNDRMCYY